MSEFSYYVRQAKEKPPLNSSAIDDHEHAPDHTCQHHVPVQQLFWFTVAMSARSQESPHELNSPHLILVGQISAGISILFFDSGLSPSTEGGRM